VTFGDIPLEVIKVFAKQPEPYKHSGGYELTALSGSFLQQIKGSHSAVQGLDMYQLCRRITEGAKKGGWIE
jgi:predicted house-cleaning NTP pyrophosphatase (Maf/HAM1 superfamily)